jgi:hypothetical protein
MRKLKEGNNMSLILQPGERAPDNKDRLMRMSFNVTQHEVRMYNRIFVSTRALELRGFSHGSLETAGDWMNTIYKEYCVFRAVCIKDPDNVSGNDMVALMQAYCEFLRKNDIIQDYWVTLDCPKINIRIDSKSMGL